jgi:hypothetical protein
LPSADVVHFAGSSFKKADSAWKSKEYNASIVKYFKKYHKNQVMLLKAMLLLDEAIVGIYRRLFPSWAEYLKRELADCATVLDLGCGNNSPLQDCNVPFSVGVELFDPYLEESKGRAIHNEYIRADIRKIELKPKCFDAIVAIEVLEHLTREEGHTLIKKMETWARKKVIITTPNGYLWQDGYHGNPLQEHRSGWTVAELRRLGFEVSGINGWNRLRGYKGLVKWKPAFLWDKVSDLSQRITYHYPRLAFQLFATKEIGVK